MLLCWSRLLYGVFDHKVEKKVIAAESTADFAAALQMDEQFLVHKLMIIMRLRLMELFIAWMTYFFEFRVRCF